MSPSFSKRLLSFSSVSPTLMKRPKFDHDHSMISSCDLNSNALRGRHVEHGLLSQLSQFSVVLRFETFPIWILSLDCQFITCIYLPDYPSWSSFQRSFSHNFHNKLLLKALLQLTPSKFQFGSLPASTNSYLHLYSGSLPYLHSLYEPSSYTPCIFLVHSHTNVRTIPPSPLTLSCINHKSVGGVTTFISLWSSQNLLNFTPMLTGLRRRLSSIIDHSIRSSTSISLPLLSHHLTLNQFLPVSHLEASVLVPSPFSASGFGIRQLSTAELLIAFGFPLSFHHVDFHVSDLSPLVPLQSLDSLLRPAVLSLSRPSPKPTVPFLL